MMMQAQEPQLWTPRRRRSSRVVSEEDTRQAMGLGMGIGLRLGGVSAFSPLSMMTSGVQAAWYRLDRGVTGSPNITALADQSVQGRNLAVNVNSPTLVTDGGKPALRFDGTSAQELRTAAPTTCASAYFLAMVAKIDTSALANNGIFGVYRARGCAIGSNSAAWLLRHANAVNITAGSVDTANYKRIIATGGSASPFAPKLWINGVLQTLSPSGPQTYLNATSAGDFISLGHDVVNCKGYVREAFWVDRLGTDTEAAQADAYLASQWVTG